MLHLYHILLLHWLSTGLTDGSSSKRSVPKWRGIHTRNWAYRATAKAAAEIRKAFHKLAKANHPDVNPGDKASEERFKTRQRGVRPSGRRGQAQEVRRRRDRRGRPRGPARLCRRGALRTRRAPPKVSNSTAWTSTTSSATCCADRGVAKAGRRGGGFGSRGGDVRAALEIDLEEAINGAKQAAFVPRRTHARRNHSSPERRTDRCCD